MRPFKRKLLKTVCVYLVINILAQCFFPVTAYALTSGPANPEFSSFEPVATTNMVNEFTGEFTYNLPVINVPGPNGSGYAASLSYHSGTSPEEEASWVGYGWTLNPGAINRGKQGLPDDYNNDTINYTHVAPKNWTASLGLNAGLEIYSTDNITSLVGITASAAVRYNNYRGFGTVYGIKAAAYGGLASLDYTVSGEDGHSFSLNVNPAAIVQNRKKRKDHIDKMVDYRAKKPENEETYTARINSEEKAQKEAREKFNKNKNAAAGAFAVSVLAGMGAQYGMHALAEDVRPMTVAGYTGSSINVSLNLAGDPSPLHIGFEGGLTGSYSEQVQEASYPRYAYGYMYQSASLGADASTRMMDYTMEKESMYNKRDMFLSIPHSSPDIFNVSGEGIGGGFRMYNRNTGHYYPTNVSSPTTIGNLGFDATLGLDIQPLTGFNVGAGWHTLSINNWANTGNTGSYAFAGSGDEANFFRYNGDLGGNLVYSYDDNPAQANVSIVSNVLGVKQFQSLIDTSIHQSLIGGRSARSSYIGYHTNSEMSDKQTSASLGRDVYYRAYSKDNPVASDDAWDMTDIGSRTGIVKDRIGEIATVNSDGNRYVYGLPVYAADESNLAYSINEDFTNQPTPQNNFLVYRDITGNTHSIVGETRKAPYATAFLLSEITTPDYVDRTFDGPTTDDFGGWTKFSYRQVYGSTNKNSRASWYRWRFPYQGLTYDRNELCDPRDDMGNISSGAKEVYYLKTIETKTHIAYFITNSTVINFTDSKGNPITLQGSGSSSRKDGIEATDDATAANSSTATGTKKLERLEKIVLFGKDANNKIVSKSLKVVHFDYYDDGTDYTTSSTLSRNLPNGAAVYTNGKTAGKLTLRRVWFEYEGTANTKISPYEFVYKYKLSTDFQNDVKTKYNSIVTYGDVLGQDPGYQNPDYSVFALDNWGNYCANGAARHNAMTPWVYQGVQSNTFDPAAWQLKVIRLPSGGEILIHYEQNEYGYVQDQMALGMVSLKDPSSSTVKSENPSDNKYYLNLNDVDIDQNSNGTIETTEMNAFASKINTYVADNPKLYFKFLYSLVGAGLAGGLSDLTNCGVDYVTGYMNASAAVDGGGVYISFTGNDSYKLPRDVCKDFVTRTKAGLNLSSNCGSSRDVFGVGMSDPTDIVKGLVDRLSTDWTAGSNNCLSMSLSNSFIRVPLLKAKKGGGIRVKRVLMHDPGIESNDESLYGSEYIYKNTDGSSSGVATNEPPTTREENALVSYLVKRAPQSLASRIISGKDKEIFEGPIGEPLLPPAQVGYSRVITRNIHSGKSGTGFRVNEYYTVKDYPFSKGVNVSELDDHAKDYVYLPGIWVNITVDNRWVSQGYSFVLNSMHGQSKRVAIYGGTYVDGQSEDSYYKSYEQVFEYFQPGEKVPVLNESNGTVSLQYMGKEMDLSMEMKSVEDIQNDASLQVDFSLGIALFIPIFNFSVFPYFSYTEKRLRSHVMNKVVRYPAIQKRVTTVQDGIVHITENKLFNKLTGQPIATIEKDSYDGLILEKSNGVPQKGTYTNYVIPACYIYPQMRQKAKNERYAYSAASSAISSLGGGAYTINLTSSSAVDNGSISNGDLVRVSDGTNVALFHVNGCSPGSAQVQLQELSFLPNALSSMVSVEVINSGYTNQLNTSAGTITTYGADYTNPATLAASPLSGSTGAFQQNNLANVLSASASTFDDNWYANAYPDYSSLYNPNPYELGAKGKWRLKTSYVLKKDIQDAVSTNNRVYTSAGAINGFTGFNYNGTNDPTQWLGTNTVMGYSPDGNVIEENNILGIRSTAKFGYGGSVPVLVAKNAPNACVLFNSYEDISDPAVVTSYAHSGSCSYQLNQNVQYYAGSLSIDGYPDLYNNINPNGFAAKVWLRTPAGYPDDISSAFQCYLIVSGGTYVYGQLNKIARVGEWTLCEYRYSNISHPYGSAPSLFFRNNSTLPVWIDDVRAQPLDASMNCYVYDRNNLRLLASFDDQHFGLYYQYNAEGKLVRKLAETERGMKTITETQYNTPQKSQ